MGEVFACLVEDPPVQGTCTECIDKVEKNTKASYALMRKNSNRRRGKAEAPDLKLPAVTGEVERETGVPGHVVQTDLHEKWYR